MGMRVDNASPVPGCEKSEKFQVALVFPVGDVGVVVLPFLAFEIGVGAVHQRPHHRLAQRVALKGVNRFLQGAGQQVDAQVVEFRQGVVVHVFPVGIAGVEPLLDALQPRREHHRRPQIQIGGNVGGATLHPSPREGNPQHVGAVVIAIADVDRCPSEARHAALADQPLVAVDRGAGDGADGFGVAQNARDELVAQWRELTATRVTRILKQVFARVDVGQGHVVVRPAAGAVGEGFGHEAGKVAVLADDLLHHEAEEGEAIAHGQGVRIGKVGLKLTVGILMIKGIHVPAEVVHGVHQFGEPAVVVEQAGQVVAGLRQGVAIAHRLKTPLGFLKDKKLGLDAQVEGEAQAGGLVQHAPQDEAGTSFKGLA